MSDRIRLPGIRYFLIGLLLVSWLFSGPVSAQDALRETTSLKFVPADAAFYATMLRNREVYDAVAGSKAVAKVKELAYVQMALSMLDEQMKAEDSPVAGAMAILQMPENQQLVQMLGEMVSDEVFIYGDVGWAELFDLLMEMNREARRAMADMGGDPEALEGGPGKEMLELFVKYIDQAKIPDTVIGFKLKDTDRAKKQLKRLDPLLPLLVEEVPQLEGRVKWEAVAGSEMLTLKVDGTMIPWDEVPLDEMDDEEKEVFDKMVEKIKKMTLTVALGVWGDYLLLSMGDTNEHLATLGEGKLLIDHEKLAPLRKVADKRIKSVSYASDDFMKKVGSGKRTVDDVVSQLDMLLSFLPTLSGLEEEFVKELRDDLKELGEDIKQRIPDPGAAVGFSYMTERGFEGYVYNWGEDLILDGSQKLSLLDHVGGDPILFSAGRTKYAPENYDLLVKWIEKIYGHADRFAKDNLEGDDREEYDKLLAKLLPLFARLNKINREMLIPSLKDSQSAVVLDAKTASKQWHQMMPPAEEPLPMLELGLVFGVSDAKLLQKACSEYYGVINDFLAMLHETSPDEVPEIELPPPATRKLDAGTVYYYPIPETLGLDKKLSPNAGLSESVGVLALTQQHTERLLAKTPLAATGLLADCDRPLASATMLNWAALMDASLPWVNYAVDQIKAQMPEDVGMDADQWAVILEHVHTGMEVLKCFRGVSSITYFEDGVIVTHYKSHFEDLK